MYLHVLAYSIASPVYLLLVHCSSWESLSYHGQEEEEEEEEEEEAEEEAEEEERLSVIPCLSLED